MIIVFRCKVANYFSVNSTIVNTQFIDHPTGGNAVKYLLIGTSLYINFDTSCCFSISNHCSIPAEVALPTIFKLPRVNNVTLAFNKVDYTLLHV